MTLLTSTENVNNKSQKHKTQDNDYANFVIFDHNKKFKANMGYLTFYVISTALAMFQVGYILAPNYQVQSVLDV
jgi:hypothetical protein